MAQPIPLEIRPRNPRAELRSRLEQAPEEHAEAVLAAYEVVQELHNRGVLEILRGALAASDEILEKQIGFGILGAAEILASEKYATEEWLHRC